MRVDLKKLNGLVEEGWLSRQHPPEAGFFIYNYTPSCQYGKHWTEETMMCRKFFNIEELDQMPAELFFVQEKLYGSLGILYWVGDEPRIATRGSFASDQAIWATKTLQEALENDDLAHLRENKDKTFLFEIIYNANRIVVDYMGEEGLFFLACIDNETGADVHDSHFNNPKKWPWAAKWYENITDLGVLKGRIGDNEEGFVIRFEPSGLRVKIKGEEYVRLHRLVTGVNSKVIWEHLRDGKVLDELLERVPDEFFNWVKTTSQQMIDQFDHIKKNAEIDFHLLILLGVPSRKIFADAIKDHPMKSLLFSLLDKKPIDQMIWKMIKPKAERPFRNEV